MIYLAAISQICNIVKFAYGIIRCMWANRKKISHLLQQVANKFRGLLK